MQVGQTWIHKNGLERVTLEERSEDRAFWYVTKMMLTKFSSQSNPDRYHEYWTGSMVGNLGHYGNDVISDDELLNNYAEMVSIGV
jgi:hypothetical protein